MEMSEIGIQRLNSQHVGCRRIESVSDLVKWMGAMQAQDLNSAKWAIGVRLPGVNVKLIDEAINNGEIIRTHALRPTWHLISADDYHNIMNLTAPGIHISIKSRQKQLELDEKFFNKSDTALEQVLEGGNHMTREELVKELSKTISNIDSSRMNHILLKAELDRLIVSGRIKNGIHSYALAHERFKSKSDMYQKDEALTLLATKYFASHGPATLLDFNWWSGLSITDCRKALEMVKHDLQSMKVDSQLYWFKEFDQEGNGHLNESVNIGQRLFLLPAYDEFIISYKDRSAVMSAADHQRAVSSNGIFRPTIVLDGNVVGLWNKKSIKNAIEILPELSIKEDNTIKDLINKAAGDYVKYLG